MDERFVKKIILPSFVIVFLSNIFFYELKYLIDRIFFKKKHLLIVGILSAPNNFQQRLSLRKTWLQMISEISGSYYFLVGNEICEVPPLDRPDPFRCINRPFVLSENATSETEFSTMKIAMKKTSQSVTTSVPNYVGFGFYVRSEIRIRKLGILQTLLAKFKSEVQVKLISAFDKNVLASVTFQPIWNEKRSKPEILSKSIKPVPLVESSEALVRLEGREVNDILLPDCKSTEWVGEPQVIDYITLWPSGSIMPTAFTNKSCTYVAMTYSIVDPENIKKSIRNKHLRLRQWQGHNRKLSLQLNNESKIYKDIMFLDVVDVYRNITLKLIQFYKRILDAEYFQYVLKTDDDSFVDLLRVHNQLKTINKEMEDQIGYGKDKAKERKMMIKDRLTNFWWWSFFREFWRVQHSGKWRDFQYRSASYPSFPCGGGYVVSKGIVDYVASNERNLNYFQGEDVSMGIWMSSLSVVHYRTPGLALENGTGNRLQKKILTKFNGNQFWSKFKSKKSFDYAPDFCDWNCGDWESDKKRQIPSCNRVQMSVESMYEVWNDYINQGFL